MFGAEFWVAVSFVLFVALVLYVRVPARVGEMLDRRAEGIARELEDARKLREEAQELLAAYQRQQRQAEEETEQIIALAREEAENLAKEAREALSAQLKRREQLTRDKIALAEQQAIAEVRAAAADIAVAAARHILAERLDERQANALIDLGITEVRNKLH